ncbi:hypothetical protein DKX15_19435, partial [Enterococcus faecium]
MQVFVRRHTRLNASAKLVAEPRTATRRGRGYEDHHQAKTGDGRAGLGHRHAQCPSGGNQERRCAAGGRRHHEF